MLVGDGFGDAPSVRLMDVEAFAMPSELARTGVERFGSEFKWECIGGLADWIISTMTGS